MDLFELTRRTRVRNRDLRYVVDHRLLPGLGQLGKGRGRAREFTPAEALGIALIALLRRAGLAQEDVGTVLGWLVDTFGPAPTASEPAEKLVTADRLAACLRDPRVRVLEVADGAAVRVRPARGTDDGDWFRFGDGPGDGPRPLLLAAVHLGELGRRLAAPERTR